MSSLRRVMLLVATSALFVAIQAQPALASVVTPAPSSLTWAWQNPIPGGWDLQQIVPLSSSRAMALDIRGRLLTTIDSGATWTRVRDDSGLMSIACLGNEVWAAGADGMIIHSSDFGASWSVQNSGVSDGLVCVSFSDASNGWVSGGGTYVLRTTNGGGTWTKVQTNSPWGLGDIVSVDATHAWSWTGSGRLSWGWDTLVRTTNGGATWTKTQLPGDVIAIDFTDQLHGVAAGSSDKAWVTSDGGATWTPGSGFVGAAYSVDLQGETGWAVGQGPRTNKTSDGGKTWTPVYPAVSQTDIPANLRSVRIASDGSIWIAGHSGFVIESTDSGGTWQNRFAESISRSDFYGVSFGTATNGVTAGDSGLFTKDGGLTWKTCEPLPNFTLGVRMVDATRAVAVGYAGCTSYSDDGGATWTQASSVTTRNLSALDMVGSELGWAGGDAGVLLRTTNGGESWTVTNTGLPYRIVGIDFIDAMNGWLVGADYDTGRSIVAHSANGGSSWQVQAGPLPGYYASSICMSGTEGWAGFESYPTGGGALLHTIDGVHWSAQTPPSGIASLAFAGGTLWATRANVIAFGASTSPALMYSRNHGSTWRLSDCDAQEHPGGALRSVAFVGDEGWVVGGEAMILHTSTGGVPPNSAPVAVSDSADAASNTTLTVTAPGLLANDTDVDTDPLSASLVTTAAHGMVALDANGSYAYRPIPGWVGTDTFTYRVYDGALYSNPATVTIRVLAATTITVKTTATAVRTGNIPILSGAVTPVDTIGCNMVVYVMKPGKTYWTYSSNRTVYSWRGAAAWQYKYYFKSGMVKGYYKFKAVMPSVAGRFINSTSPTTVSIRLR